MEVESHRSDAPKNEEEAHKNRLNTKQNTRFNINWISSRYRLRSHWNPLDLVLDSPAPVAAATAVAAAAAAATVVAIAAAVAVAVHY